MEKTKIDVYLLKCKPNAQFHFGTVAYDVNMALNLTSEYLHSDTLFSALINEYDKVWRNDPKLDTNGFVKCFTDDRLLEISSALYYIEKNGKRIFFFPKPANASTFEKIKKDDRKSVKKIQFVSLSILNEGITPDKWIAPIEGKDTRAANEKCVLINKKFVCTESELELLQINKIDDLSIFELNDETKVNVHSLSKEDTLYNQTNIQIGDNSSKGAKVGFWFAFKAKDQNSVYYKRFHTILKMLQSSGIGGQRSTGCGFIEGIESTVIELNSVSENQKYISLSLISPSPNSSELKAFDSFQVCFRGGRHTGKKDKILKTLRMIKEGAVLSSTIVGDAPNISPEGDNEIFLRYGKGFFAPLHPNFNQTEA